MYMDTKEDPSLGSICLVIHPKCLRSLEGALLRMFVFCMKILIFFLYSYSLGKPSKKKNSGYNEFGTKGGGVSDLNHYLKQL